MRLRAVRRRPRAEESPLTALPPKISAPALPPLAPFDKLAAAAAAATASAAEAAVQSSTLPGRSDVSRETSSAADSSHQREGNKRSSQWGFLISAVLAAFLGHAAARDDGNTGAARPSRPSELAGDDDNGDEGGGGGGGDEKSRLAPQVAPVRSVGEAAPCGVSFSASEKEKRREALEACPPSPSQRPAEQREEASHSSLLSCQASNDAPEPSAAEALASQEQEAGASAAGKATPRAVSSQEAQTRRGAGEKKARRFEAQAESRAKWSHLTETLRRQQALLARPSSAASWAGPNFSCKREKPPAEGSGPRGVADGGDRGALAFPVEQIASLEEALSAIAQMKKALMQELPKPKTGTRPPPPTGGNCCSRRSEGFGVSSLSAALTAQPSSASGSRRLEGKERSQRFGNQGETKGRARRAAGASAFASAAASRVENKTRPLPVRSSVPLWQQKTPPSFVGKPQALLKSSARGGS